MFAAVIVAAEAITPCISLKERKMKKHIEKSTKLMASECLALAILRVSLKHVLMSNQIEFTQVDLSSREKTERSGIRMVKLKIIRIEAFFVDMTTPRRLRSSVDAYITLEKQKAPIVSWRPFQVGMNVKNCGLKMPHVLMSPVSAPTGTIENAIVEFAENLK